MMKFLGLPFQEKHLLLRTLLVITIIRFLLWTVPFRRLATYIEDYSLQPQSHLHHSPKRITQAVRVTSRYVPRATCLTQALSAQWLLADAGYTSQLRLGIRKDKANFQAHAWLELEGQVIIGNEDLESYQTLPPLS